MLRLSKSQPWSFLSYHRVYNKSNTTGATSGAGVTYSSKPPEFTPGWCKIQSLPFCIIFCRSVFVALSILFWSLNCLFFDLRFWLLLWYVQTYLTYYIHKIINITTFYILFYRYQYGFGSGCHFILFSLHKCIPTVLD